MGKRHPERYQRMLERLRQAREEAGLRQEDVAESLGVRQTFISKIELGERRIDPIDLVDLSEVLGKPVEFFLQ